jgi:hypothetical protein
MVKRLIVVFLMLGLILSLNNFACAAGDGQRSSSKPSASAIAADIVFLRPIGLIGTVLGTCGFIIALPVTIPTKKVDSIGRDLVIDPFHYTFERPLGKF